MPKRHWSRSLPSPPKSGRLRLRVVRPHDEPDAHRSPGSAAQPTRRKDWQSEADTRLVSTMAMDNARHTEDESAGFDASWCSDALSLMTFELQQQKEAITATRREMLEENSSRQKRMGGSFQMKNKKKAFDERKAPQDSAAAQSRTIRRVLFELASSSSPEARTGDDASCLPRELCKLAKRVFCSHIDALHSCLGLNLRNANASKVLDTFLSRLFSMYINTNLYHNGVHALDVLMAASSLLRGGIDRHLSDFDVVAVLIAAVAHDVGHFGASGARIPRPTRGGSGPSHGAADIAGVDPSALERFHFETFLCVVKDPASDILRELSLRNRDEMMDAIKRLIIATDITKHNTHMDRFVNSSIIKATPGAAAEKAASVDSSVQLPSSDMDGDSACSISPGCGERGAVKATRNENLQTMVLKFADVSNTCRNIAIADEWGKSILLEQRMDADLSIGVFRLQSSVEEPYRRVERSGDDLLVAHNQFRFVCGIVRPMFDAIAHLLYADIREHIRGNLEYNLSIWGRWNGHQQHQEN